MLLYHQSSWILASILKQFYTRFVSEIFYEFEDVVTSIYDVLLFNFISITSVGRNPRNSCVKSLHSHAIESLVSMTSASILDKYCMRIVGGCSFEFYAVVEEIFIPYITTMFHITLRTIYSTFREIGIALLKYYHQLGSNEDCRLRIFFLYIGSFQCLNLNHRKTSCLFPI